LEAKLLGPFGQRPNLLLAGGEFSSKVRPLIPEGQPPAARWSLLRLFGLAQLSGQIVDPSGETRSGRRRVTLQNGVLQDVVIVAY
jgi:hypothetical protein